MNPSAVSTLTESQWKDEYLGLVFLDEKGDLAILRFKPCEGDQLDAGVRYLEEEVARTLFKDLNAEGAVIVSAVDEEMGPILRPLMAFSFYGLGAPAATVVAVRDHLRQPEALHHLNAYINEAVRSAKLYPFSDPEVRARHANGTRWSFSAPQGNN